MTFRFIQPEGDIDFMEVLTEYRRRLDAYPARHPDDVACNLNYEVQAEQVRWCHETGNGLSVVSARDARELSTDGRL